MIEVKEMTKKYGKKKVLDGISFTAEKDAAGDRGDAPGDFLHRRKR